MTPAKPESLAAALAELQQHLPRIVKDTEGQAGPRRYKYANLSDISAELLPVLGALGLSFATVPTLREMGSELKFVLHCKLRHAPSGELDEGFYPLGTGNPQQLGSAISYARRYALNAMTGLAPDDGSDDDAQAAEEVPVKSRTKTTVRRRGKIERVLPAGPDPADPWLAVDANGERQPPGDLPVTYPPGDRQFRALAMHFKRLGYDDDNEGDREERLVFTAALAGSGEISSSKELTQDQLKLALMRLGKVKDRTALVDAVLELKESEGASA